MAVEWKAKVCMVGDSAVGKTSLIRRYVLDQFDDRYTVTIGAKVTSKELAFAAGGEEVRASLLIWDIMGAKGVRELLREAYFHNARGIVAVCDLTRPETLESLPHWIASVKSVAGTVPCIVLANKVDLGGRTIPDARLHEVGAALGGPCLKTSAKTGENVEEAFLRLAQIVYARTVAAAPTLGPGA